jgi:hypothetical protein
MIKTPYEVFITKSNIRSVFDSLLSNFKFYRKLIGGRWILFELGPPPSYRRVYHWINVVDHEYWDNYEGVYIRILKDEKY